MPVLKSLASISNLSRLNSLGSPIPISGHSPVFVPYKKWAVPSSPGDQAVRIKICPPVPRTVVFQTEPRAPDTSATSFTEWASLIRKLLPSVALMPLVDATPTAPDSKAYVFLYIRTIRLTSRQPWTFSPTILTNDYYKLLMSEKWVWKKSDENAEGKIVKWVGPAQYEDQTTKTLMMLPADYSLVQVSLTAALIYHAVANENRTRFSRNGLKHTPTIRKNSSRTSLLPLPSSSNWVFLSKVIFSMSRFLGVVADIGSRWRQTYLFEEN